MQTSDPNPYPTASVLIRVVLAKLHPTLVSFRGGPKYLLLRWLGHVLTVLACGLVTGYSLWYTSSGRFPEFPPIQNDYIDLGKSFLLGKLSLLEDPDPRLGSLGNPYDYNQRKGIPYHWDASYFDGKYYLYWGPLPALVSAGIEMFTGGIPSASLLVDLAYIGLMGTFLGLLIYFSRGFPSITASGSIGLFILIGFLNLPILFTIGQPRHYQASIIYGQFFLLSGLLSFALYWTMRKPTLLVLSGLAWGLSIASRYNLAISVAVYILFALTWFAWDPARERLWLRAGQLLAPLVVCLIGLGLYNLARFDNPFETGLAYQLTIPELRDVSYSTDYLASNLYVYLLYPLTGVDSFPFIQSSHFRPSRLPEWLTVPHGMEFDQVIFGIFRSVPATWLIGFAVPFLVGLMGTLLKRRRQMLVGPRSVFLPAMIASGAAGQFLFLLIFFYAAERYVVDFYLPLILLIAVTVWHIDNGLVSHRLLRIALWLLVSFLTTWTVAIGYFSCFGVPTLVSIYYDPVMLAGLASFWNERFAALRYLWDALLGINLDILLVH